jgi:acetyltransferase-like isoleucine patch superfamily enzyme
MNKKIERLIFDSVGLILSLAPLVISLFVSIKSIPLTNYLFLQILSSMFIFTTTFLFSLFVLRLLIPKLKEGVFPIGLNRGFIAWFLHLSLSRSIKIAHIKNLLYSTSITRFLFFKAMGANISFNTTFAINAEVSDLSLITIKDSSTISDNVKINAHLLSNGKVFLSTVVINEQCYIGENSKISARVKIAAGAVVSANSYLANTRVKAERPLQ